MIITFHKPNNIDDSHLASMVVDRVGDRTIGSLLLQAFLSRYKEVLSKAHTAASTPVPKVLTLLTKEETNCKIDITNFHNFSSIITSHNYLNIFAF